MIFTHPVKFGLVRSCAIDIGAGPSVGVTYSVSDASLISVSPAGLVAVLHDVTTAVKAFVIATETSTGIRKAMVDLQVVPSATDISLLEDSLGVPDGFFQTFAIPSGGGATPSVGFSGTGFALVFGGGTGASPTVNSNGVEKYSFVDGTKTSSGIALMNLAMSQGAAASNTTNAFVFGGGDINLYNGWSGGSFASAVENYVFATLGTKGGSPPALAYGTQGRLAAASDKSANAFTFGGYDGAYSARGYFDVIDWYLFNNLASKGTTSSVLQHGYQEPAACGNSVFAFFFPGFAGVTATLFSCEQYPFATCVRTILSSSLSVAQFSMASAGNETLAAVFGGFNASTIPVGTVDTFNFATPGTRGTTPTVALAHSRNYPSAASNSTSAFIFGGCVDGTGTTGSNTCESYQFASMASRGTEPATLSSGRMATAAASNHQ
jgi:hypothetical protein